MYKNSEDESKQISMAINVCFAVVLHVCRVVSHECKLLFDGVIRWNLSNESSLTVAFTICHRLTVVVAFSCCVNVFVSFVV
jgi:pheromone shutdown protein TraB